jgi:cyclophilin family peptidyl-prolyl cis-trans isomerase
MCTAKRLLAAWLMLAFVSWTAGCGSEGPDGGPKDPAEGGNPPAGASAAALASTAAPSDSLHPLVVISTSMGDLTVKLDAEKAGITVDNFLRYVDAGHYNGTVFHEVHAGHVIIGGAYTPELVEKKTDGPIFNEARQGLKNLRGTIAMARKPDVIDSATCHFYINVQDHPNLDHKSDETAEEYGYCVFGEVSDGMDVVERIANVAVHDTSDFECIPVENVLIQSIRRGTP